MPAAPNRRVRNPVIDNHIMLPACSRSLLSMTRKMTSPAGIPAASRLATVQRHLSSTSSSSAPRVDKLTVFGAGLMGAGIAQVGAQNRFKVNAPYWSLRSNLETSLTFIIGCALGRDGSSTSVSSVEQRQS